ncbi:TRAP transporter small permease [Halarsenatibacter silvermanii]|uniref:Tripartite ATP-independent transporter, DctQ component n=1 Tax=Halarsenatibacter silvermanii TaxID=321763 RepID=A0A1G9HF80_9FIRM|nr:TRAP transporter small permease [Halarsenatibacter silvermanii]SDL11545.1 Tripartite ATP-independent transporter, DctQ component [Halarsenatibacter silvermanii]
MIPKLSRRLNSLIEKAITGMIGLMLALVLIQVVARYFLGASTPWTSELSRYLMVWIALVGASVLSKEEKHAAVNLFKNRLPPRLRIIIEVFINILILLLLFILVLRGFRYSFDYWNSISPATGIRRTWAYLSLPVGALLMFLQTLSNTIIKIDYLFNRRFSDGEEEKKENYRI